MIGRRIFIEGMGATLVGLFSKSTAEITTATGITISDVANDRPEFRRRYAVKINGEVSMKIEIRNFLGVTRSGELTQRNGRWVTFEPERPADKILDREILPLIEKYCTEIIRMDDLYRRNPPASFIDEDGVKWTRAES